MISVSIFTTIIMATLLFFMMLFAAAGTLQYTGVLIRIADSFLATFGGHSVILIPLILVLAAVGSAFVDNVIFVAAFMPVVNRLEQTPLVWALVLGTCFGGNITIIGSTANIVALGILEKRYRSSIRFIEWLKVGAIVGLITGLIAWAGVSLLAPYMPTVEERRQRAMIHDRAADDTASRDADRQASAPSPEASPNGEVQDNLQ